MTRFFALTCGVLLSSLALTACSGGNDTPSVELQVLGAARDTIASRRAAKTVRPPLTRAALDPLEGAFQEVTLERNGQLAYLYVAAVRDDDQPGQITVWRSEDNVTLALRNGVLISLRGLGGGFLSSSVQVSDQRPGPASGKRVHHIRGGDNKETRLTLTCDLADLGPETVVIIEQAHSSNHIQERCRGNGDGGTVVNDYWIDTQDAIIWQSRQWAGPGIGYLRLRQLTK